MARVLFAAWPPSGHLYPCLALARELGRRTHDVAVYSGNRVRPVVKREGFRLFPFERVDEARLDAMLFSPRRTMSWRRPFGFMTHLTRVFADTLAGQVEDLERVLASWRPDLIVTDESLWAPSLVLLEKHGTPVVVCGVIGGCLLPGRDAPLPGLGLPPPRGAATRGLHRAAAVVVGRLARDLRRRVDGVRRAHGLPPLATTVRAAVGRVPLYLVRGCPEFDYWRRDLPPSVAYVGPLDATPSWPQSSSAWIHDLPRDRPLVYVSEGTMHSGPPVVLRAALEATRGLDVHVVMATGTNRAPGELGLGPLPPHVTLRQWVPQRELFARADVVVTVGGSGTVLGALAAGVPLLVVPAESDQPDNARRVLEAGVGLAVWRHRCTPARVRRALETLLAGPSYRWNARALARSLARYRDADYAADLVESQGFARARRSGT